MKSKQSKDCRFALIFWPHDKKKDYVEIACIPVGQRRENIEVSLNYKNYETNRTTREKAVILKIRDTMNELYNFEVDTNGKIVDSSSRLCTRENLDIKKKLQAEQKKTKKSHQQNKKNVSQEVINQPSIMDIALRKEAQGEGSESHEGTGGLRRSPRNGGHQRNTGPLADTSPKLRDQNSGTSNPKSKSSGAQSHGMTFDGEESDDNDLIDDLNTVEGILPRDCFREVTLRDIKFQQMILNAMIKSYEARTNTKVQLNEKSYQIPEEFTQPGESKMEISANSGVYVYTDTILAIKKKARDPHTRDYNWKLMVNDVMTEIYGPEIANFSAKGKRRNQRPRINQQVYQGVYNWIKTSVKETKDDFNEDNYIKAINSLASNRRKYQNAVRSKMETSITTNSNLSKTNPPTPNVTEEELEEIEITSDSGDVQDKKKRKHSSESADTPTTTSGSKSPSKSSIKVQPNSDHLEANLGGRPGPAWSHGENLSGFNGHNGTYVQIKSPVKVKSISPNHSEANFGTPMNPTGPREDNLSGVNGHNETYVQIGQHGPHGQYGLIAPYGPNGQFAPHGQNYPEVQYSQYSFNPQQDSRAQRIANGQFNWNGQFPTNGQFENRRYWPEQYPPQNFGSSGPYNPPQNHFYSSSSSDPQTTKQVDLEKKFQPL